MYHNSIAPPTSLSKCRCCQGTHNPNTTGAVAPSRRALLCSAAAGAALGLVGIAFVSGPASAQSVLSPDEALKAMMDGNDRFLAGQLRSFDEDLKILKDKTSEKQEPFAIVLACADSRVPVELIFDQSIGHLFVVRVAGNVATSEVIASIEYGVAVLGARALMVLGHTECGAISAAIAGKSVPGQISALYAPLRPAIDEAGPNLAAAVDANARRQASLISGASPVIAGAVKDGKLRVVAARYDIVNGKVTHLA